jgi:hypothetical protein
MGFSASVVTQKAKYGPRVDFWENARSLQAAAQSLYTEKRLVAEPLVWCHQEPTLLKALTFKRVGGLVFPDSQRYAKLNEFSSRQDMVRDMPKREKMDSLDSKLMATAITNLARLDFPRRYGELELERLIMNAGGAYPLAMVGLVVGAVTASGKLSLLLEFAARTMPAEAAVQIVKIALDFLFGG